MVMKRATKYGNDPLVPIRGDRVHAALDRSGLSVSELARRLGGRQQQRIDFIVRGVTKRCRRSLRARIAEELATSVAVLGGAPGKLPREFHDAEVADLAETPIAQRVLWRAVCKAATRDNMIVESDGMPPGFWLLLHPSYWRSQLLSAPPESVALNDLSAGERDRLGAMMADVMLLALKPWFDGRARLVTGAMIPQSPTQKS